jgi:hypothetical protein
MTLNDYINFANSSSLYFSDSQLYFNLKYKLYTLYIIILYLYNYLTLFV